MHDHDIDALAIRLEPHYGHFDVSERLLFTGHSHQAWPDVALKGLEQSFTVAASEVDNKWEQAFNKVEVLRNYLRRFYDDPDGLYTLGQNTHQLLVAWLSSFDLKKKPKIVTTDSEFHSMYRQLHRLGEEDVEIVTVEGYSPNLAGQIADQLDDRTAAVMLSRVFFESGVVNQHLTEIAAEARTREIPLLIDDYHGTNVVPLSISGEGLEDCYFLIGGYKYLQWGEGNCFLRFPKDCELRPAVTGWFAAFNSLDQARTNQPVSYDEGNQRFASGTFDPTSQFRAAKVVHFFEKQGLTSQVLRKQYLAQVKLLKDLFLEQDFAPTLIKLRHNRPLNENGGFLALQSSSARTIQAELMKEDVYTDARGDILRIGPAPYISTEQIHEVIERLSATVRQLYS